MIQHAEHDGEAQRWFEWRRNGLGILLPVVFTIPFLLFVAMVGDAPERLFSPFWILLVLLAIAICVGPEFGEFRGSKRAAAPCAFLATRPLSCSGFVRAKFLAAAIGVFASYGVVLPVFLVTAALTGWLPTAAEGMVELCGGSTVGAVFAVALLAASLPALAWAMVAANMFVGLTGRKWIVNVTGPGLAALFWLSLLLAWWLSARPELVRILQVAAPLLMVILLAAKLFLAVWIWCLLLRRRLVEPATVKHVGAAWAVAAVILAGTAIGLLPAGLLPWYGIVGAALLLVPLARLGLAPLALEWNRHR